jgi:hypothetical protein
MKKVQPTFAERLRRAHAALEKDLLRLEEAARPPSAVGHAELGARLQRTRGRLTEHFGFEEENGYMDAVLERDPNRERTVRHLHDDHRRLLESLDALRGRAAGGGPPETLRADVLAWLASVRDHESRENALVQDAFNVDLSAED